jgi:hypothetical protein
MKKIAVFVEGHTESKFVQKLLTEIFNKNSLQVECLELTGPIKNRNIKVVRGQHSPGKIDYYVMIYNCRCDGAVKSDILQQYSTLVTSSYTAVLGLRDVYPLTDIEKLKQYATFGLPNPQPVRTSITLAVMEVESWFLAEETHYKRLHTELSDADASSEAGLNVAVVSTETVRHPSSVLNRTYQRVGMAYRKKDKQVQRTVDAIDYANLYIGVRERNKSLDNFLHTIEDCI